MSRRPIDARVEPGSGERSGARDDEPLREVFAHWASGVAVVTARDDDGHVYGMTVAAFTPVSVDPPLALLCVHNDAPLASVLVAGSPCGVSILTEGQKRAAGMFADRFSLPGDVLTVEDGVPVVADAAATLIGAVDAVHEGGDHRIVVVRIRRASLSGNDGGPLLYWRRAYRRIEPLT